MKVALCLTGLVGSKSGKSWDKEGGTDEVLETCAKYFNKHMLSKNDVDVFFHTWEIELENQLVEKYNPKSYIVEPQKVFTDIVVYDRPRTQAHYSKWYSIREAIKLKKDYELENNFEYDFVIQSRFDVVWTTDVVFESFDNSKFYIPRTHKKNQPWGWPNEWCNREIGDLFFFSSSDNMDKFAELYDNINRYLVEGCPTFQGISNHMLAKWHLTKLGLLPDHTELAFSDLSRKHISISESNIKFLNQGEDVADFQLCRGFLK